MRQYSQYSPGYGGIGLPTLTRAVKALLIANVAAFVLQSVLDRALGGYQFTLLFALGRGLFERGFLWQLVTYMFLHANAWHLLWNMVILFFLGGDTERAIGSTRFLILYFASGVLGGLCWLICSGLASGGTCVGASGAVYGVLGAFAALFPYRRITFLLFFVLPITLTARTLALILGGLALLSIISTQGGGIAHAAHLAGGLAGYFYVRAMMAEGLHGVMYNDYSPGTMRGIGEWWRGLKASVRRRRIKVSRPKPTKSSGPSQSQVDAVLDKLADSGWAALSKEDRELLDEASKR